MPDEDNFNPRNSVMPVMQNHAGRTFGRITLIAPVPGKTGYWKGTCSCGNPVQKRLDNLKRPGVHSCGKCLAPAPAANFNLEERVHRLEQVIALYGPHLETIPTPSSDQPLKSSVISEVPVTEPWNSRFSRVTRDDDLWEARALSGKVFFWGVTEEEAAFGARVYLESIHCSLNHRIITEEELTLSEERREEIRFEVSEGL